MSVRVIEYMLPDRKNGEVFRPLTSIVDHELAPSAELAALYEQRWEFEITLDELEAHQIAGREYFDPSCPTSSNRKYGRPLEAAHCCSRTIQPNTSCARPPTTSVSTPTDCRSSEASESYAARSPTRRVFSQRLDTAITDTLTETLARPNSTQHPRSYPRVANKKRSAQRSPNALTCGARILDVASDLRSLCSGRSWMIDGCCCRSCISWCAGCSV